MDKLSQTAEKNPRKYCHIDRFDQAKILEESKSYSQRDLAEKYDIPRTTLQHWIERERTLKGRMDPKVVEFFESVPGQAWLHEMCVGVFLIFHLNGNSGIPDLHDFFEIVRVSVFVGTSISALQKVSKILSQQVTVFGKKEIEKLSQNMPHNCITGALDENFIMDAMTLVLMEPTSGFILAEKIEEKRDAETWHKVTQTALKGLNVTIKQLVGDEASGLTKFASSTLNVMKGPDLFHVQQEITKGLTSHLTRLLQQAKKKQEDLKKEKLEAQAKFEEHMGQVEELNDLSRRGVKAVKRVLEIADEEKANQKKIEEIENRCKLAQEARRDITHAYHPFCLDTGKKQTPETVKAKLEKSYKAIEAIATIVGCTDKQKQKLEKSKSALKSMIATLMFFFSVLASTIKSMGLDESGEKLFEKLVSKEYMELCLQRNKKKKQKEGIRATLRLLEGELQGDPQWQVMSSAMQEAWRHKARECAKVFQRSSSCVEGRNGQLSLKFHAFRRINEQTLGVLTILHNFFIKRADGTTAAERFFEQKHNDLFRWLLGNVELPRPRRKHKRVRREVIQDKLAA